MNKLALALAAFLFGWVVLYDMFPLKAQQPPYTTYPIHSRALGQYSHCLVVTAQGYAVVLEYPCPN